MTVDRIGAAEAERLIRRIAVMAEPDRKALIVECAALCPPGKNKRQIQPEHQQLLERRAA